MTATITERVAAGAALLDEKRPGWWQRIDLTFLSLSSTCDCVLGQEFDGFYVGQYELFGVDAESFGSTRAADHGFDAYPGQDTRHDYLSLESAWTDLIEDRRAAAERAEAEA